MKLKFSLITILLCTSIQAREVIVYTYDSDKNHMFEVLSELMAKNGIKKEDFRFIKKKNPCEDIYKSALLHICFKGEEAEPLVVRQDKRVLQNTFGQ
ncbi:hypothetical protein ABMA79_09470 [Halobacteriovorax sp. HFRX-2_2]|uniref:hypothetical protein n=1 Tax=unclassified Halobacteriovorax TaxID=2639665 RepID=UPI00371BE7AC